MSQSNAPRRPVRAPWTGRAVHAFFLTLTFSPVACNWTQSPATPTTTDTTTRRSYVPVVLATPTPAPKPTPKPAPTPTPAAPAPAPKPAPTPTPAPADPIETQACPTPAQIRIKVHLPNGPNGWVIDSVALTCDKKFCSRYKLPDGTSRNCCPLGPEGSKQRARCEEEMVPDGPSWQLRGGSHRNHPNNPWLHWVSPPASVRACLPHQGICSDWLDVRAK